MEFRGVKIATESGHVVQSQIPKESMSLFTQPPLACLVMVIQTSCYTNTKSPLQEVDASINLSHYSSSSTTILACFIRPRRARLARSSSSRARLPSTIAPARSSNACSLPSECSFSSGA